ncbi:MAG: polysaccharide deacetylase family protein, partial [Caloramator sp.]|nr:polysaccharide deacetylase family protein [Caloramator sp.]
PERFEADLKMLKEKGFNIISLRYLLLAIDGQAKLPPNAVVITFDDGLESFYTYAYPLLKKYNMPAINFVITKRIDYKPQNTSLEFMNRTQLKEMLKSGIIDIQSHTHDSHEYIYANRNLDKIGKLASPIYYVGIDDFESQVNYEKRVREDLSKSFEVLNEILGEKPYILSFPFGHYNDRVVEIAKEVGYSKFVTIKKDINLQGSKDRFIYRINAGVNTINEEKLFNIMMDLIKEENEKFKKFIEIEG